MDKCLHSNAFSCRNCSSEMFDENTPYFLTVKPNEIGSPNAQKKPHKCPVCNGSGEHEYIFDLKEKCRACKGECVLWG